MIIFAPSIEIKVMSSVSLGQQGKTYIAKSDTIIVLASSRFSTAATPDVSDVSENKEIFGQAMPLQLTGV